MLTYSATSTATPTAAWSLMAEPSRWSDWAPHLRGAWGLGEPEVRRGALGAARLLGVVPVPARILDKHAGRMWAWQVGPVVMVHRVETRAGGSEVAVDMSAPRSVEALLRVSYGPVVAALVRRLARVAERD